VTDLAALLARIEQADGPDREIDAALYWHFVETNKDEMTLPWTTSLFMAGDILGRPREAYTASIDAIVALIERALPALTGWALYSYGRAYLFTPESMDDPATGEDTVLATHKASPALALCAAFVRAMMAQQQEKKP
jgi:hypothetical protein